MVTIKEIAKEAGVSVATVSNVLNGKNGAAGAETTEKIFAIAKKWNYTANSFARRLQQGKSNSIGVITEDLTVFNTPEIIDGLSLWCMENRYELLIENMRLYKRFGLNFTDVESQKLMLDSMFRNLIAKQVEGIVYIGHHCRPITYVPENIPVPLIYAYCYPAGHEYPAILFDDEKAAYDVISRLLALGRKNIGIICGPIESYHTQKRLAGCQQAFFDNNILYNVKNVLYGSWEKENGYQNTVKLLEQGCDAIFAMNDFIAAGAADCCRDRGLALSSDIAIFGFDNREASRFYSPRISTVELPLSQMGGECAKMIVAINTKKKVNDITLMKCTLRERESSAEKVGVADENTSGKKN